MSISSFGQDYMIISPDKWNFMIEDNTFDGTYKSAFIIGESNSPYVHSPVLSVNRTNYEPHQVFLSYFPAGICGENIIWIKFNKDSKKYELTALYSFIDRRYVLIFNNSLTVGNFIRKLKLGEYFEIRLINECIKLDVRFILEGANEALKCLDQ